MAIRPDAAPWGDASEDEGAGSAWYGVQMRRRRRRRRHRGERHAQRPGFGARTPLEFPW